MSDAPRRVERGEFLHQGGIASATWLLVDRDGERCRVDT